MKKKTLFLIPVAVIILAIGIMYLRPVRNAIKNKTLAKVEAEKAKLVPNEDNIVQEMEDPYFIKKQWGYSYPNPENIMYASKVTGTLRHATVLLPAGYSEDKEYPVLYLIHGLGGTNRTWVNKEADVIMQNLYYFEGVPEMIVVCTNNNVNIFESTVTMPIREVVKTYDLIGEDLITSLMPYVEEHYSVKTGKENTAIAGNSMGGRESLYIAFNHQDKFDYIGLFSSAGVLNTGRVSSVMTPLLDELVIDEEYGGFEYIMLCVGREDNVCGRVTYEIHDYMTEHGIDHVFYDTEGGHQNTVWQNALYNFGKNIFK
jgi:enterochelin esterase family protein